MAGQTTTSVVQVTVTDSGGYSKSFNLEYPKQNLTLNQIKTAFQPAIDGGWWLGSKGDPIVAVSKATYSTSTKIEIAGGEITFTPSTLALTLTPNPMTGGKIGTGTITVEGGVVQNASVESLSIISSDNVPIVPRISIDDNVLTIDVYSTREMAADAQLTVSGNVTIWIDNKSYTVPVTKAS